MFRTELRRQAARGPDFAGHYTLAMWGCGCCCTVVAVVDSVTGQVTFAPFAVEDASRDGKTTCHRGTGYRLSSELFVATGKVGGIVGTHYYRWHAGTFTRVHLDTAPTDVCSP